MRLFKAFLAGPAIAYLALWPASFQAQEGRPSEAITPALYANQVISQRGSYTALALDSSVICPCSLWSSTTMPSQVDSLDPTPGEYGMRFQTMQDGYIQGIRFYKSVANIGTHLGNLWDESGNLLATVTFTGETASGWQQAMFSSPLAVTAGTSYVVSYFAPAGHYSIDSAYFANATVNGPLQALVDGSAGANGIYAYSTVSTYPGSSWNSSNYWVDVVFNQTDTPRVTANTPQNAATNVPVSTSLTATFNETMSALSINNISVQLLDVANNVVPATVTYNAATMTATLTPSGKLGYSSVYTAIVHGGAGSSSVTNLAGNAMPANYTWSFTTIASLPTIQCPCTIWPSSTIPDVVDSGDGTPGEYGVRFQASQSGYITGVRYYKSQANKGTHIGNLWSNTGTLLAAATFIGETNSGWQQVNFARPVAVTAGTTYLASYYTPTGHYAFTKGGLAASIANPPLTALGDGTDGANAAYSYSNVSVFPSSTWNSSNYWVDAVFSSIDVPNVVGYTPLIGSASVPPTTAVTAVFNEAVDPATVDGSSFQLLDGANNIVSAIVTYNSSSNTAVLTPTNALANSMTYTAVVRGGLSGSVIRNPQGNALPASFTWSFTVGNTANTGACPCSIWSPASAPVVTDSGESANVELGVKFASDQSGYITGIRFYKSATNSGTHVGNLWSSTGNLLGSVAFSAESATGWQQANFATPIAITAGVSYVASYHTASGHYAYDQNFFLTAGIDNAPLHALANGATGGNGVFTYSTTSSFPNSAWNASNYWVDIAFVPNNSAARPVVISTTPNSGATGGSLGGLITAIFSEPMTASSINANAFQLLDSSGNAVAGTVSYTGALVFQSATSLLPSTQYTAIVKGTVLDYFGNTMGSDYSWSFTTAAAPPASGPGGPILVISSTVDPFSRYYGEILLNEGMNEFLTEDITKVTSALLGEYDVVLLGNVPLTSAQASVLSNWVQGGGNLIVMHPDAQLAGLLGIIKTGNTLSNGYLLVNTARAPGTGIVGQTIQFHGTADLYTLNGATSVATLYTDAATATSYPAVVWQNAGAGKVAAFTFDLARSVVYARQGNPDWSGEQRNLYIDPTSGSPLTQIRSDDLFFGAASFDPQPDWVNLDKVQIPQADEQQRLLVNLIEMMNASKMPLPRFWYFPNRSKAVVIMTGDDHNHGGTPGRFDQYLALSPPNCSVLDWECVRATSYVWPNTPIPNYQTYVAEGFEISNHHDNDPTCTNWTAASLDAAFAHQMAQMGQMFPNLPPGRTNRTHCVLWADYDSEPQIELKYGVRLDTTYYYWPDPWVQGRPGFFTGSGMPMRFTDRNGNLIDVYQVATQIPDETMWNYPRDVNVLLDNAIGSLGFYGVFTPNMHTDDATSVGSDAIVATALDRGIPVISADQMLTWLDGRNTSSLGGLAWDGTNLQFTVTPGIGARNLQAMVPSAVGKGAPATIRLNGQSVAFTTQTIKGINYAMFPAVAGSYVASYGTSGAYVIAGAISGTSVAGAIVTLTGAVHTTATVDSNGGFSIAGVPNGTYTLTPVKAGFMFTPTSRTVTVLNSSVTGLTFSIGSVQVQNLTVSPTSVVGGIGSATGTVTLNGPAPYGGLVLSLSAEPYNVINVSTEVDVPPYGTTATFPITTYTVDSVTNGTITISSSAASAEASLTVAPPQVQSISLNPNSVIGGATSIATITLNTPAPDAGMPVSLSSSNVSVASVPSSVTVPPGGTIATFNVTSKGVSSVSTATISATANATVTAAILVNPPALTAITLNPQSTAGGNNVTGTVTLNGIAPSGGAVVSLQSNNVAATVPSNLTIAAGATSASFTVTTKPVSSSVVATVTATYRGVAAPASLSILPPSVQSLSLSPSFLFGGVTNSTGTVTLSGPAPSALTVSLSSNNSSAASVPATITIGLNAKAATFTVASYVVSASTPVTISATYGGTASSVLTVNPIQVQSLSLSPSSVLGGSVNSTATVRLNTVAPSGGMVVNLASDNIAAATVPASVSIAANSSSATFIVTSKSVTGSALANISATYNGSTASSALTVLPLQVSSVTVNPTSVVGGAGSTGTVTLTGPARTGGAVVTLSSNNPAAGLPASVTIASGATTTTFNITTTPVSVSTVVTVTATFTSAASTTLTVTPPQVRTVSLSPASVTGGTNSVGTVTLSGQAPSGGFVVSLSSSRSTAAQVPASVTVAAGATTVTFTVTTSPVSSNTTSNIVAAGGAASATLTISAPALSSLALNPTSVKGGTTNSTGTVTLTGRAPTGGSTVTLSSSNTSYATVPTSVTVAAGNSTATFTVTSKTVVVFSRTVTITGTYGVQRTATLTVTP